MWGLLARCRTPYAENFTCAQLLYPHRYPHRATLYPWNNHRPVLLLPNATTAETLDISLKIVRKRSTSTVGTMELAKLIIRTMLTRSAVRRISAWSSTASRQSAFWTRVLTSLSYPHRLSLDSEWNLRLDVFVPLLLGQRRSRQLPDSIT